MSDDFYARYVGADPVTPAERAERAGHAAPREQDRGQRNGDDIIPDGGRRQHDASPGEQHDAAREKPDAPSHLGPVERAGGPDEPMTSVYPPAPDHPPAGPPPRHAPPTAGSGTGPQPTYDVGYQGRPPPPQEPAAGHHTGPPADYPGTAAPGGYRGPAPAQPGGYPGGPDRPAPQTYQRPPPRPAGAYPAAPGGGARHGSQSVGSLRATIRAADIVKPYKEVPQTGWRKVLYRSTRVNMGLSPAERAWNDLRQRVGRNLRGTYLVGVLQEKGGVAKTTVTVGLGSALSRYRDDKIVGIDANPASGNLTKRVDEPSQGTWRGLVADQRLESYSDFRHYLGKNSAGFEVLAADRGDAVLTGDELVELWRRLSRQYPVGLVDCGTQMRDDVMAAVLSLVDAVVVVSTTRLDGAEGAADTLNWLIEHGYPHLVRNAVVVISDVNKVSASGSVSKLHEQFEKAVRAVHFVGFDPHLSDATAIEFDRLKPQTRRAFIEAAASLVDGFAAAADKDPGALNSRNGRPSR